MDTPDRAPNLLEEFFSPPDKKEARATQPGLGGTETPSRSLPPPAPSSRGIGPKPPARSSSAPPPPSLRGARAGAPPPPSARGITAKSAGTSLARLATSPKRAPSAPPPRRAFPTIDPAEVQSLDPKTSEDIDVVVSEDETRGGVPSMEGVVTNAPEMAREPEAEAETSVARERTDDALPSPPSADTESAALPLATAVSVEVPSEEARGEGVDATASAAAGRESLPDDAPALASLIAAPLAAAAAPASALEWGAEDIPSLAGPSLASLTSLPADAPKPTASLALLVSAEVTPVAPPTLDAFAAPSNDAASAQEPSETTVPGAAPLDVAPLARFEPDSQSEDPTVVVPARATPLPPTPVRRPLPSLSRAVPVPAPRRPSVPPPPVPLPRPSVPPPPRHSAPPPAERPVPFVVAVPPRATNVGPTENTPTIQIARTDDASRPKYPPTVHVQRFDLPPPSPGSAPSDVMPTIPRLAAPLPGGFSDEDFSNESSIAPTAGSVAPPPFRKSSRATIGVGVAALLAGAAAVAFTMRPRTASLVVTVSNPEGGAVKGLSVRIDGAVRCNAAPCEVKDLKPGTHLVAAGAPGFVESAERAFVLDPGEQAAQHVTLSREERVRAELSVAAIGDGLHVFVDGRDLGAPPVSLHDVEPGTHLVRVAGSNYYQPYEESVRLDTGELRSLGPVRLKVLRGRLELLAGSGADGARIEVDGKRVSKLPAALELSAADAHEVTAERPGFSDFTQQVVFDDVAERTVNVSLDPVSTPLRPVVAPRQVGHALFAPRPPGHVDAPVKSSVARGPAFLDITSSPKANVVVNGRPLGSTPLRGIRVDAGPQTIVFVHPELGRKVASTTVSPGGHATVGVHF
jgi:hypothetical protein